MRRRPGGHGGRWAPLPARLAERGAAAVPRARAPRRAGRPSRAPWTPCVRTSSARGGCSRRPRPCVRSRCGGRSGRRRAFAPLPHVGCRRALHRSGSVCAWRRPALPCRHAGGRWTDGAVPDVAGRCGRRIGLMGQIECGKSMWRMFRHWRTGAELVACLRASWGSLACGCTCQAAGPGPLTWRRPGLGWCWFGERRVCA